MQFILMFVLPLLKEMLRVASDPDVQADVKLAIDFIGKLLRGEKLTQAERDQARASMDRSEARLAAAQPRQP